MKERVYKQPYKKGDKVIFKDNPFDEQIESERIKFDKLKTKTQIVTDTKDTTGVYGTSGQWIKTDIYNSGWIDAEWFNKHLTKEK